SGGLEQRAQSGALRAFELVDALPDEGAILVLERRDIADGTERDEIDVALGIPGASQRLVEGRHHLEGEAAGGEFSLWITVLRALGVDEGDRGGKFGRDRVMIEDDHIDTELGSVGDFRDGTRAAVRGGD